jgi:hypothetical protein
VAMVARGNAISGGECTTATCGRTYFAAALSWRTPPWTSERE